MKMEKDGGIAGTGSHERKELVRVRNCLDSGSKPLKNLNGLICQICGDTVGLTPTGDVFVACHDCAFPLCHRCYQYERKNVNQSCPQCKTRYKSHKESPQMEGDDDDDEDDVDELENDLKYGEGNNTKIGWQWEEDADLSSSSGHDSQIPNPHLAYAQPMSGDIPCNTSDAQSVRTTSGHLGQSEKLHPKKPGLESDEEIRRVPEMGGESAGTSASRPGAGSTAGPERAQGVGRVRRREGEAQPTKRANG